MRQHPFIIQEHPAAVLVDSGDSPFEISPLWLRERTQDPDQLELLTQQRLFDSHAIDAELTLQHAKPLDNSSVSLTFSDGHEEVYDLLSLADEIHGTTSFPVAEPWDARLDQSALRFDWLRVINDDDYFKSSLSAYLRFGYIILYNVPSDPERILEVGSYFGYVKETNFGRYFEVYSRPDGNDLAYRSVALGAHTDNPYRNPVPGIQLLHCLMNETTGGLSTLADSLKVLEQLRAETPEGYELLKSMPVRFRFVDAGTELTTQRTMIQTNDDGHPTGVHYSPRLDALPLLSDSETRVFHRARQRLGELFSDPTYEARFTLNGGELMMFDNSRVLHGRTSYDPNEGHRHLQGCYLDADGPRERYASLLKQREADTENSTEGLTTEEVN